MRRDRNKLVMVEMFGKAKLHFLGNTGMWDKIHFLIHITFHIILSICPLRNVSAHTDWSSS